MLKKCGFEYDNYSSLSFVNVNFGLFVKYVLFIRLFSGKRQTIKLIKFRINCKGVSSKIIFFTGAGISTDSGIPDFRSPGTGLWNKIKPVEFRQFIEDKDLREDYWEARFISSSPLDIARPNPSHFAISDIIHSGRGLAVITQNVDNLHQRSGIPEDLVIELHGNASYAKCLSCQARIELEDLRNRWSSKVEVSKCSLCGGIVKAATISFGQEMPRLPMVQSAELIKSCDLMIVVGSSLVVHPAAPNSLAY